MSDLVEKSPGTVKHQCVTLGTGAWAASTCDLFPSIFQKLSIMLGHIHVLITRLDGSDEPLHLSNEPSLAPSTRGLGAPLKGARRHSANGNRLVDRLLQLFNLAPWPGPCDWGTGGASRGSRAGPRMPQGVMKKNRPSNARGPKSSERPSVLFGNCHECGLKSSERPSVLLGNCAMALSYAWAAENNVVR